jgi:hypothetical protein
MLYVVRCDVYRILRMRRGETGEYLQMEPHRRSPMVPVKHLKKQLSTTFDRFFEVTATPSKAVDSSCQGSLTAAICSAQRAPLATSHHFVHRGLGRQVALQTANTSIARDKRPQSKRAQTFCSLLQREACGALFLSRSRPDACPQCHWMTARLPLQIC